jgi:hypothetical protein
VLKNPNELVIGLKIEHAAGINKHRQIAATAEDADGMEHGVIQIPV